MRKRVMAVFLMLAMIIAAWPAGAHAEKVKATRCNLLLRSKASTSSQKLATVPGGTELTVLGTSGGWTKTTYNGHTGYVSTQYLMEKTSSGYYPLREGDENPFVLQLQQKLSDLGFFTGSADGKYGNTTTEAVKAFQKQNGINADGAAGGETQRTLYGDQAQGNADTGSTSGGTSTVVGQPSNKTLKKGDKGEDVRSLQARLIELGYLTSKADGLFGAATQKAVKAFQEKSNLSADGKAGKVTQGLLYSSSAIGADGKVSGSSTTAGEETIRQPSKMTTLKRGMTSDDVKLLQERLKTLGYFTVNATGYYGSQTMASVELFQRSNGLATDGIAGASTLKVIFSTDAKAAGTVTPDSTNTTRYSILKPGMKSTAVTTMQQKLRELGYLDANATGYYGSQTKAAVIAFQKKNGLSSDGIAGNATLSKLYGNAVASGASSSGEGKISGPAKSEVKLLHWVQSVKPSLKNGNTVQVYDPATGYAWTLKVLSPGRHLDAEPLTAQDTAYLNLAFGNKTTWTPKPVYVKLPSGTWTMATTHNTPHLSGSVKDNNFDGHLCVHFLRDMAEAEKNDPKYGVQNQNVLREAWKQLTGSTVN